MSIHAFSITASPVGRLAGDCQDKLPIHKRSLKSLRSKNVKFTKDKSSPGEAPAVSQSDLQRNKPIKSPLNWLLVVSIFHINILSLCSAVYACS